MSQSRLAKNVVPMVIRTFEILEAFRERPSGLTYKDVIQRFPDIPPASIYRILCSLDAAGYLWKDDRTGRYELGVKFIEMGHLSEKRQDFLRHAHPHLELLLEEFGENVNLIKVHGVELVYLTTLDGQHPLRVAEMRNRRQCVHSSASGKIFLAYLPKEELEERLSELELVGLTPHTITDRGQLLEELERIRERRYSLDAEENILGISCVASIILNRENYPVAAMSISAPTFRLPSKKIKLIARRLVEEAGKVSERCFGRAGQDEAAELDGAEVSHGAAI